MAGSNQEHLKEMPSSGTLPEISGEVTKSFPSGWYLMPGIILSVVLWGFAIYGIVRLLEG